MITGLMAAIIIFHSGDPVPQWIEKDNLQYKDAVSSKLYFTGTWVGHKTKDKCWVFAPMGKAPHEIMRTDQQGNLYVEGQGCEKFYLNAHSYLLVGPSSLDSVKRNDH